MHAAVYTCTERVCYTARLEFRSGKQETSIEGRGSQSLSLPTQEKDHLPRDTSLVRTTSRVGDSQETLPTFRTLSIGTKINEVRWP